MIHAHAPSLCNDFIFSFSVFERIPNRIAVSIVYAQPNRVDEQFAHIHIHSRMHVHSFAVSNRRFVPPPCSLFMCVQCEWDKNFSHEILFCIKRPRSQCGIESTSGFPSRQSIRLLSIVRLVLRRRSTHYRKIYFWIADKVSSSTSPRERYIPANSIQIVIVNCCAISTICRRFFGRKKNSFTFEIEILFRQVGKYVFFSKKFKTFLGPRFRASIDFAEIVRSICFKIFFGSSISTVRYFSGEWSFRFRTVSVCVCVRVDAIVRPQTESR